MESDPRATDVQDVGAPDVPAEVPAEAPAEVPPQDVDAPPPAPRPRRTRGALALLPWVLVPAALWLLHLVLTDVRELHLQYQASLVALLTAGLLGWLLTRRAAVAHHTAAAVAACFLPALTVISLQGTDWFFSGPFGDQSFRLEYATRFADDLTSLADYTYAGAPAFYSPGWFWLVGAASAASGVPAWQAYKWTAVVTLFLAAALAFWLWRRTCSTRLSALLLAVTIIGQPALSAAWLGATTLLGAGASEPYSWVVTLALPPLLTWWGSPGGRGGWRRGVALGVALAAAAWLYLLYAAVGVLAVLVVAAVRGGRGTWRELAVAGGTSVLLVLPWLGPFVVAWGDAGRPPSAATSWVEGESYVHLFTVTASPWFALAVVGAVALLGLRGRAHPRLRGCQGLVAAALALSVVQLVIGQLGGGVLAHRLVLVLSTALLAGGTLAVVEALPRAARWVRGRDWRRPAAAALAVALFVGTSGHAQEWMSLDSDLRDLARGVAYPDGSHPSVASRAMRLQYTGDPSADELYAAAVRTARAAGQPETGPVLTDDIPLMATSPLQGYLQWWELYSNPVGDYPRRKEFLEDLEGLRPRQVVAALRADPTAPTVFVLGRDQDTYRFSSSAWDPDTATSTAWSVRLPADLFDSPAFVSTQVGDRTVAALRP
ncbi:putative Arabinofuranosyltransferase aftA [Modestobacter italicus]|uniref:Galactan 5-O-arabinofuranosyltransferase n=1 Tax=Modestobacter italicus (strain DSM 44449 / CECT 9708 / BC 501) TaxID=2732864 RepID=I4F381_MODI5|nr:arabinofuranosyltransferase [Modestobacter marinus]CCH90094.1 putative Arabinofuranosyltransferase aftA [Modestobacter marinus]